MKKVTLFLKRIVQMIADEMRVILTVVLIILALFAAYKVCRSVFGYYVTAQFTELGPLYRSMPVYYKGFKVGQTDKIKPTDDYKFTNMRILFSKNVRHLPDNITAKVKKFENGKDYIELVYPADASKLSLKKGTKIYGKTTEDLQSFMSSQADSGALTIISDNMGKTLESAQKTSDEIRGLVSDIRDVLAENRASLLASDKNLTQVTQNLAKTTANISDITAKLNKSLDENKIGSTVSNIEQTSANIEEATKNLQDITKNINDATKNLNKTMSQVDATVDSVSVVAADAAVISDGFKNTLSKRFGTMRLLFGTPVSR